MTASIHFQGWFQCRLATDPDHYQHARGKNGWTFAVAGEPDLDRIIRFHNPVAPRSHSAKVGVHVFAVTRDGTDQAAHPLIGAPVELLDNPVFDGRNGLIAVSAEEPIVPWNFRIIADDLVIEGRDAIDLSSSAEIARRQPVNFDNSSAEALGASGVGNPVTFRQQRRLDVETELATAVDATLVEALTFRRSQLQKTSIMLTSLGFKLDYDFILRGPNLLTDPQDTLGFGVSIPPHCRAAFWMGTWDADGLCGYTQGRLDLTV